jgi:hypothetical protein
MPCLFLCVGRRALALFYENKPSLICSILLWWEGLIGFGLIVIYHFYIQGEFQNETAQSWGYGGEFPDADYGRDQESV